MRRTSVRQQAAGYGLAAGFSAAAVGARFLLGDTTNLVFVTFYPAVMAAGWFGGRGPALFSVVVCAACGDYFWMAPRGQLLPVSVQGWTNLLLFVAVGSAIGFVTARLRQVQERFRSVLELTSDGFALVDRDWRFVYANPRIAAMVGLQVDELVGRDLWETLPGSRDQPFEAAARRAMAGERGACTEYYPRFGRWFESSLYPVPEGIAILSRDVSAAKELEVRRAEQLERLEAANRTKDEFLATLSHELRTPLNAVMGWTQMLRNGSAPLDRGLGAVERSASTLKQLVDDLLDTSSIVSGKLQVAMGPVDLAQVVRDALDAVRAAADAKRIGIAGRGIDYPAWARGDAARLQQAVVNLLSNAVKFTPEEGKVDVTLDVEGSRVVLRVRDTGIGIDPALLPRVFERYVQGEAPASPRRGLGLGLAIAKQVVDAHDGTLTAESDGLMRGATFTLSLPRAEAPVPDALPAAAR
jgi:PAS domain S-box-containing protein